MFGMLPSRANPTMRVRKVPPIQKFGLRFRRRQTSWVRARDHLRRLTATEYSRSTADSTMRVRKVPPIQKFGLRFRRRQTSWLRERDRLRRLTAVASSGSSEAGSRSSGASDGGEESIDMGHTLTLGSSAAYSTSDKVEA